MEDGFADLVSRFVLIQEAVVNEFVSCYPIAKANRWMIDVPRNGWITVDGDIWRFLKHGAGIRFYLEGGAESLVVDVHCLFDVPRFVDWWRLVQYLESLNFSVKKENVIEWLGEMSRAGTIYEYESGYVYRG